MFQIRAAYRMMMRNLQIEIHEQIYDRNVPLLTRRNNSTASEKNISQLKFFFFSQRGFARFPMIPSLWSGSFSLMDSQLIHKARLRSFAKVNKLLWAASKFRNSISILPFESIFRDANENNSPMNYCCHDVSLLALIIRGFSPTRRLLITKFPSRFVAAAPSSTFTTFLLPPPPFSSFDQQLPW